LKSDGFEPRVLAQDGLLDSFIWRVSYEGEKNQVSSQIRDFANDLSLENYVWVSSGKGLSNSKFDQFASGFVCKTHSFWILTVITNDFQA